MFQSDCSLPTFLCFVFFFNNVKAGIFNVSEVILIFHNIDSIWISIYFLSNRLELTCDGNVIRQKQTL